MQFELVKNSAQPLKIFIYKDKVNSLVANLAYTVDESMSSLMSQQNEFNLLGTLDVGEVIGKVKPPQVQPIVSDQKKLVKSEFISNILYTVDNFISDPKDQKTLKRIINKIHLQ